MTKSVPEMLRALGELYEERNALYGDNYKFFGQMCAGIFPNGLKLETVDDWNRIGIFIQVLAKVTRYGQTFERGGHPDSVDDITVYSQMLRELDSEIFERRLKETFDLCSADHKPVIECRGEACKKHKRCCWQG